MPDVIKIFRRDFIKKCAAVITGFFSFPFIGPLKSLFAQGADAGNTIVVVTGPNLSKETVTRMAREGFNALGGISRFVRRGQKVVIKPNIGWNSPPERAHNTNPDLVEEVARLCVRQGARVTVFDRTCNADRLCYVNSGIRQAALNAGASIEFIDDRKFRDVPVPGGLNLRTLAVYGDVLDADVVINIPIAKHHGSSRLTLAMKNLMGVIGGRRGLFHLALHRNIVDFTKAIPVHLNILDATRILLNHGPNGGTPADVRETRTVIFGTNPVTVDAYGTSLFGLAPRDIEHIRLAGAAGMGETDMRRMNIIRRRI